MIPIMSRPTRARGLKPDLSGIALQQGEVAPHAGAWIETLLQQTNAY